MHVLVAVWEPTPQPSHGPHADHALQYCGTPTEQLWVFEEALVHVPHVLLHVLEAVWEPVPHPDNSNEYETLYHQSILLMMINGFIAVCFAKINDPIATVGEHRLVGIFRYSWYKHSLHNPCSDAFQPRADIPFIYDVC